MPGHIPVLLDEVLESLQISKGSVVVDCTVGLGGHSFEMLKAAGKKGRLVGLDLDPANLEIARDRLAETKLKFDLVPSNFAALPRVLAELGLDGADAILADLGVASTHIDRADRGFSFLRIGPLDMRMNPSKGRPASDVLQEMSEPELARVLRDLGDEEDADAVASAIAAARPIATTARLAEVVCLGKGIRKPKKGWGRLHPAAKTFQALRMVVNRELENLTALLASLPACLRPGGRVAIIAFHSGEDRLVKTSFKEGEARGLYAGISKEAVRPSEEEQARNPRSWSARLRWAERSA